MPGETKFNRSLPPIEQLNQLIQLSSSAKSIGAKALAAQVDIIKDEISYVRSATVTLSLPFHVHPYDPLGALVTRIQHVDPSAVSSSPVVSTLWCLVRISLAGCGADR